MKPYYTDRFITIYHGDCRELLSNLPKVSVCITDPPTGETKLEWDKCIPIDQWISIIPTSVLWVFGSLKFFLSNAPKMKGRRHIQEVIWEKHNGSGFHADRLSRVHMLTPRSFRKGVRWPSIYKAPVFTNDATKRTVRRKHRPPHMGDLNRSILGGRCLRPSYGRSEPQYI